MITYTASKTIEAYTMVILLLISAMIAALGGAAEMDMVDSVDSEWIEGNDFQVIKSEKVLFYIRKRLKLSKIASHLCRDVSTWQTRLEDESYRLFIAAVPA